MAAETRELAVGPQSIFLKTEARKGGRAACSAARASQFSQLSAICSHNAGARSRSKPAAAASEASDPCQMTWLFQNYLLIKTNFQHFYFWFINTKSLEIRCVNQRQASKSLQIFTSTKWSTVWCVQHWIWVLDGWSRNSFESSAIIVSGLGPALVCTAPSHPSTSSYLHSNIKTHKSHFICSSENHRLPMITN